MLLFSVFTIILLDCLLLKLSARQNVSRDGVKIKLKCTLYAVAVNRNHLQFDRIEDAACCGNGKKALGLIEKKRLNCLFIAIDAML
jgi:hypothetical protein